MNLNGFVFMSLCSLSLLVQLGCTAPDGKEQLGTHHDENEKAAFEMYKKLLKHKRAAHQEAVKSMMQIQKHEKLYQMVNIILEKIFKVMVDAKLKLTAGGFSPGDPMPQKELLRDAFANVAENTAFLGDILLRFPDMSHDILRKNKEMDLTFKWSLSFTNETGVYEGNESKLLNLMAQELGVVEKDENYVNPYRHENKEEAFVEKEVDRLLEEKIKELERKKKKKEKKKKGPRLSPRVEL